MAALTTVEPNHAHSAMRAMALALIPGMSWRHHGIGVLQGYIAEDTKPEVRLHIWSPSLVKPGMSLSGDIHDHRFDMVSHVLCGQIGHEEIFHNEAERTEVGGFWSMLALTHARAAKDSGYHGPTKALPGFFNIRRNHMIIGEEHTYRFPRGRFHRSPVHELAVTCVEKHNQSNEPARILYPTKDPPVMAFGHEMDWALIGPVIQQAKEALARGEEEQ